MSFMQEIVGVERKSGEDPCRRLFFLPPPQNRTIHDGDNVEGSHLIKLVHAVQSLKRKKCTHVMPWKWANYQIQIN